MIQKIECQSNNQFIYNSSCELNQSIQPYGAFSADALILPNKTIHSVFVRAHNYIIETLKMKYGRYIEIVVFFFSVIPQAKISAYRFVHGRFTTFYGMNNITINICAFFKGTVTSNLMILTAAKAKKHTNLYHGCPYKVNLTRTTIVI